MHCARRSGRTKSTPPVRLRTASCTTTYSTVRGSLTLHARPRDVLCCAVLFRIVHYRRAPRRETQACSRCSGEARSADSLAARYGDGPFPHDILEAIASGGLEHHRAAVLYDPENIYLWPVLAARRLQETANTWDCCGMREISKNAPARPPPVLEFI
jgi:hypothetical protein